MTDDAPLPSLEELEKKLINARHTMDEAAQKKNNASSPFRIGSDIVSGVMVGTGAGYFLDHFLGTKPVFLLICFFLGAIAGGLNIYRAFTKASLDDK